MTFVPPASFIRGFSKTPLITLLVADVVLIAVSAVLGLLVMLHHIPVIPDIANIGRDSSLAETLNFAKWIVLIGVFLFAYHRQGHAVFLMLGIVFALILADDSLQLHEQAGGYAYLYFGAQSGHHTAIGELGFWAVLGMVCLGLLRMVWPRTPSQIKARLWMLGVLFGGVVACGMGMDLLHLFAPEKSLLGGVIGLLEDGGEMVFVSLMVAFALGTFGPGHTQDTRQDTIQEAIQKGGPLMPSA